MKVTCHHRKRQTYKIRLKITAYVCTTRKRLTVHLLWYSWQSSPSPHTHASHCSCHVLRQFWQCSPLSVFMSCDEKYGECCPWVPTNRKAELMETLHESLSTSSETMWSSGYFARPKWTWKINILNGFSTFRQPQPPEDAPKRGLQNCYRKWQEQWDEQGSIFWGGSIAMCLLL